MRLSCENAKSFAWYYKKSAIMMTDPKSIGEHMGSPLPKIVQWFKTMTTSEYIREVKAGNLKTI
jgi:hypothetical protein